MTAAVLLGLGIGVLLGLVGGGGSILAVPALIYGVGLPLSRAVPTSLLVVGISSAVAAVPRWVHREVQWRIAAVFGAAGIPAAFAGAAINRLVPPPVLLFGFVALMLLAAYRMLQGDEQEGGDCALPGGGVNWRSCLPKAIAAGMGVGFLTGLFGVGGGFVIVPALVLLLGLPMTLAVGTSLVIVGINSAAGFLAHLGEARLDPTITVAFTLATVTGALVAGRLGSRLSGDWLRRGFAYLVVAVAVFVAFQAFSNPGATG